MFANIRSDAHRSRRICIPSMLDLPPAGLCVDVFGGNEVIMGTLSSIRERSIYRMGRAVGQQNPALIGLTPSVCLRVGHCVWGLSALSP
jgi:hypothetical protein